MLLMWPIYEASQQRGGFGLTLASTLAISLYVFCLWWSVCRSLGGRFRDLTLPLGYSILMSVAGIAVVWIIDSQYGWFYLDESLKELGLGLLIRSLCIGGCKGILGVSMGIGVGLLLRFHPLLTVLNQVSARLSKREPTLKEHT